MSPERPNGRRALTGGGSRSGASRSPIPADAGVAQLAAELEAALTDAVIGRSAHEGVEGTLQREARALLLRRGLGAAHVQVVRAGEVFSVAVVLPARTPVVLQVRVRVGD